jgi:hypothetical protein
MPHQKIETGHHIYIQGAAYKQNDPLIRTLDLTNKIEFTFTREFIEPYKQKKTSTTLRHSNGVGFLSIYSCKTWRRNEGSARLAFGKVECFSRVHLPLEGELRAPIPLSRTK